MGEILEALQRLQTVETHMAQIRAGREEKQRRATQHQRQFAKAEQRLQDQQRTWKECQKRLDLLQLDTTSREENIDRHRQALNKAKTNKEYAAILTAMNTEKADNAKLENEVLQLMERTQTLKDQEVAIEAEKAKFNEDVERANQTLADYDEKTKSRREELQAEHDQHAHRVPPTALELFTRVARHHDGVAMVPIVKIHPRRDEYICSGCNMTITLEVVAALQLRDEVQSCKTCGRILFVESSPTHGART